MYSRSTPGFPFTTPVSMVAGDAKERVTDGSNETGCSVLAARGKKGDLSQEADGDNNGKGLEDDPNMEHEVMESDDDFGLAFHFMGEIDMTDVGGRDKFPDKFLNPDLFPDFVQ